MQHLPVVTECPVTSSFRYFTFSRQDDIQCKILLILFSQILPRERRDGDLWQGKCLIGLINDVVLSNDFHGQMVDFHV